jgi:hypothetical protein
VLAVERWKLNVGCSKFVLLFIQKRTFNVQRSTLNIEQTCPRRSRPPMKHYAGNHAKKDLGIHNLLQINRLQLREARKSGSNGFPAGSSGFPARRRGFPTGSNALRVLPGACRTNEFSFEGLWVGRIIPCRSDKRRIRTSRGTAFQAVQSCADTRLGGRHDMTRIGT